MILLDQHLVSWHCSIQETDIGLTLQVFNASWDLWNSNMRWNTVNFTHHHRIRSRVFYFAIAYAIHTERGSSGAIHAQHRNVFSHIKPLHWIQRPWEVTLCDIRLVYRTLLYWIVVQYNIHANKFTSNSICLLRDNSCTLADNRGGVE